MRTKILVLLLALLTVVYSVAPAWVVTGVNLNYSVGSTPFTFSVLSRNTTDIQVEEINLSSSKTPHPGDENASKDSGDFWFDSSLLSSASTGSTIGDYSVTDEGTQTFAGTSWDTLTLQGTVTGAMTTKVLDRKTGLLLKQTVDAPGAPVVTLTQYYIPSLAPAAAPPGNTQPAPAPTAPPANTSPPANATQPAPGNNTTPQTANQTQGGQPAAGSASTGTAPAKKQCCTSAFLLLVVGIVALRNGR
jgi:hypothetical protein